MKESRSAPEKVSREGRFPVVPPGAALIILAAAALLYLAFGRVQAIPDLIRYQDVGRGHDNEATFSSSARPPAGGVHHDTWLNCGIYVEPVETGQAIHSLEHGAVWITYRPDLNAEEVQALRVRVHAEDYLILSPYPGQERPIVLTAWAAQLEAEETGDGRITQFIEQYQLGPTAPEPGAPCTGGSGDPLD